MGLLRRSRLDGAAGAPHRGREAGRPGRRVAALALPAWAYPRVRGGRRGAIALAFGAFGTVAGIEAVHYTAQVGAPADDYTGLLAVPAGLLLVGLGAVTLWTTRRTKGATAHGAICAACCSVPQASASRCSSSLP
jgi:hypothetical protein